MSKPKKNEQTAEVTTEVVTEAPKQTYQDLLTKFITKSGVIRGLAAEGKAAKDIYKILKDLGVTNNEGTHPIRYQHIRNVLNTPVKKAQA